MKRAPQSSAAPVVWLAAGTGLAGILALSLSVFMIKPTTPAPSGPVAFVAPHATPVPAQAPNPQARDQPSMPAPAQSDAMASHNGPTPVDRSEAANRPTFAQPPAPLDAQPRADASSRNLAEFEQPQARRAAPPSLSDSPKTITSASVTLGESGNSALSATQPIPNVAPVERANQVAQRAAQASPTTPIVARPIANPPPEAPQRAVQTVVVNGSMNRQMAFSIDNIGRGNSLVIQLPRAKPKS
jgi:hypothetical protein